MTIYGTVQTVKTYRQFKQFTILRIYNSAVQPDTAGRPAAERAMKAEVTLYIESCLPDPADTAADNTAPVPEGPQR